MSEKNKQGLITKIVSLFLRSKLAIVLIIVSMLLGIAAVIVTPKEEDPQIVVPMADVVVQVPGVKAAEVNRLVATPLERLIWQVKGIEDVYSVSRDGEALVTARFFVGQNQEDALVRLLTKIDMNADVMPSIVKSWLVKPVSIDDVPIVNVALYSAKESDFTVRRVAEEVLNELSKVENISKTCIVGGRKLVARVELTPYKLAAYKITPLQVYQAIQNDDLAVIAGKLNRENLQFNVTSDSFLVNKSDLSNVVVGVYAGRIVYLKDIAKVLVGPSLATNYSFIDFAGDNSFYPATTVGLAKKSGSNAVTVANNIVAKLKELKKTVIPSDIKTKIIRNYGKTAHDKVNTLLYSLGLAILTVVAVLMWFLGWREALIVAVSVPISFALALFVDYLFGYSINRVTLFALILSLGLVVDDPITNVENIQRHILQSARNISDSILIAVNEVLPPVIMSSLTIIVSFLPLFFITGMMGPYMSPMASTVPLTIIFSTVCSLTVVPWMSYMMLRSKACHHEGISLEDNHHHDVTPEWVKRGYRKIVEPFLESSKRRWLLLIGIIAALLVCVILILMQKVPLQLLPFDNKNELQLVINMPEGTTLEGTNRVVNEMGQYLHGIKDVKNFVTYVGSPSPMDFNGMVRHYYLRQSDNLADIRVNLVDKGERSLSSHELALKMRKRLEEIASANKAKLAIIEMPPGPPVLSTIVAEIRGTPSSSYAQLIQGAKAVESLLKKEKYVVDVSDSSEKVRDKLNFVLDKEKAALNGVSAAEVASTLKLVLGENTPMLLHKVGERNALVIQIMTPLKYRSSSEDLSQINVRNQSGGLVPLVELGHFEKNLQDQPIYQKNLHNLVYVYANVAGRPPADVVLQMHRYLENHPLPNNLRVDWTDEGSIHITVRVFRDMGLGFAAALLAIYVLLFLQTDSFIIPLIMMLAIPLTIIGIVPGFWLLNVIANHPIGGFPTPIFFTATSMIGMIALGGIVIRNSLILISFIDNSVKQGMSFKEAVLMSGAVRLRPIFLTAVTAALGAWPITLDPIFSGLAWALIFGLCASTAFSLLVIPVTYYALVGSKSKTSLSCDLI
ncbi:MAG: efflux RND transporter permease subunit [Gammaproteobacteria bacterium]|nr:efflux RND transporter permease subunit [Gammaproteobacteria bacterium]